MKRLLFVDDNRGTLDFYTFALRNEPYIVVTEEHGTTAVELFAKAMDAGRAFDLVVTDLYIDATSTGISVASAVRDQCPECKIVICTGRPDKKIEFVAQQLGAATVWFKPVGSAEEFVQKVRNILEMPENITRDRRRNIFARSWRTLNNTKQGTLVLTLLFVLVALQIRSTLMAPRLYSQIGSIDRKLDGAVSTGQLPAGYRVFVPSAKACYQTMEGGAARLTFQFEPKDAAAAASLANERGVPFNVSITRSAE